jgi:hypothetical protein
MPRANLKGQTEVEFLRKAVRATFEKHANRTLVANTNKGNYVRLAEEISELAQARALGTRLEKMDMTVSEGQVRSLFIEANKDFLDYFVQACYLYTQGIGREEFLALPENIDLIKTWEEGNGERQMHVLNGHDNTLQQDKIALEKSVSSLEKRFKTIVFVGILGLIASITSFYVYFKQNKRTTDRLNIWTGNISNISKENLLPHVEFLKPQAAFLSVVDTIVQSLLTPSVFQNAEAHLPIVHYKNIVATSGYKKYGNSFYPDQISIIPLHGFADMQLDTAILKTKGMASYLYTRYGHFALQNGETHVSKDILAKIMCLEKTDFDVDLIYVGYKQDIDNPNSEDFVLRYPPYKFDASDLHNYVMTTRQWWQEAMQKTGIHWQQNFSGRTHYCGISKPYPTVRTNAPNQRTFWVELSPNPQNDKTRMVLAIDLILKNGVDD